MVGLNIMPVYETRSGRKVEKTIAALYGAYYNTLMIELPPLAPVDYIGVHRAAQELVEIRMRNIKWGQYPDIFIKHDKFHNPLVAKLMAQGFLFRFVVCTQDSLAVWTAESQADTDGYNTVIGGKDNYGKTDAQYKLIQVPVVDFEVVKLNDME